MRNRRAPATTIMSALLATVLTVTLVPAHALAQPTPADPYTAPTTELDANLARYRQLAEDLSVTVAQTHIIERQIDDLAQQIAAHRAAVGRLASAAYRGYRTDPLHALTDASSTREILDRLLLLDAFARRRQREIDALTLSTERYDAARRTLETLVAQQRTQQRALVALRYKLQATRS